MSYKVMGRGTANALVHYWKDKGVDCTVRVITMRGNDPESIEVVTDNNDLPLWDTVCEAFVAGRMSMAR